MKLRRGPLVRVPILHELHHGLRHRGAVKGGAVLHLHHLVPVREERLRSPAHDLVDARRVLAPVRKPGPSRQLQRRFAGHGLCEYVEGCPEQGRVLALEGRPHLLFGTALGIRDALQLHHERAVQHVAPVRGGVDAVEDHRPS